jgi:hypothetical protein
MAYGSEGSKNARFKDFLNIYILKIYIYIRWSNIFSLQRPFLEL